MSTSNSQMKDTTEHLPATEGDTDVAPEIQTLRALHQVKLVEETDEGGAAEELPNGVYGFTYSPQEQSPVFSKRMFQIFEVHKTLDGEVQIIGFISETDAQKLAAKTEEFISIHLYPEPYESAVKAIGIPKSQILEHRGPIRENGNPLKLKVEPFSSSVQ